VQQFRDGLVGLHGIEAQQSIERVAAISGPKHPPRVAKRNAHSSRMGLAFLITTHHNTTRRTQCCDRYHNPRIFSPRTTTARAATPATPPLEATVSKRAGKTAVCTTQYPPAHGTGQSKVIPPCIGSGPWTERSATLRPEVAGARARFQKS